MQPHLRRWWQRRLRLQSPLRRLRHHPQYQPNRRLPRLSPQHRQSQCRLRAASLCRRRDRALCTLPPLSLRLPLRRHAPLREPVHQAESSADAQSSTGARQADLASVPDRVDPVEHREDPEHAVPCIPRAARRLARPPDHVLALANVPAWVRDPASASVPVLAELQASCRLREKRRGRSAPPEDTRAVADSNIRSPKKAR